MVSPKIGWVKANWDETLNDKSQTMGVGVVIRDCAGAVMACLSSPKVFHSHPIVTEYNAMGKPCLFVWFWGL